jgi:hypothetical protein
MHTLRPGIVVVVILVVVACAPARRADAGERSSRTVSGAALVVAGSLHVAVSIVFGALTAAVATAHDEYTPVLAVVFGPISLANGVVGGVVLGTGIPTLVRGLREEREGRARTGVIVEPMLSGLRARW